MGDYSDVVIVDADGRRIPWPRVSHFDDDAMRDLMRQVVDRLYTFHVKIDDPGLLLHLRANVRRLHPVADRQHGRGHAPSSP